MGSGSDLLLSYFYPPSLQQHDDNTRWKCCHNTNTNTKIQIQKSPEVSQGVTYCSPTSTLPPCNSTMITPDGNVVIIQIQIQKYKYKYQNTNTNTKIQIQKSPEVSQGV